MFYLKQTCLYLCVYTIIYNKGNIPYNWETEFKNQGSVQLKSQVSLSSYYIRKQICGRLVS